MGVSDIDTMRGRVSRLPWYYLACAFLIVIAIGLRFYSLPTNTLTNDEAVAANASRGTLAEVHRNTLDWNSSPIVYPYVLWAVQKAESSPLSVRIVPAIASVLTVAALLLWLPKVGVSRTAAFLAGLMATASVESIRHAQSVREYGVDALVTTVIIGGLLWRVRGGGKLLLSVGLFTAPLVQYGLALFGAAVIGALSIGTWMGGLPEQERVEPRPARRLRSRRRESRGARRRRGDDPKRVSSLMRTAREVFWPSVAFTAGCLVTYLTTAGHHRQLRMGQLVGSSNVTQSDMYRSDPYRYVWEGGGPLSFIDFMSSRTWWMLEYHLTSVVAAIGLMALGFAVFIMVRERRLNVVVVLFVICVAVAILAAAVGVYPYGNVRQAMYLGPLVFLAVGCAVYASTHSLPSRLGQVVVLIAGGLILLSGVYKISTDDPYRERVDVRPILAALDASAADDVVYVPYNSAQTIDFYTQPKPDNYFYGGCGSWVPVAACIGEIKAFLSATDSKRAWLAFYPRDDIYNELEALQESWGMEVSVVDEAKGFALWLIDRSP